MLDDAALTDIVRRARCHRCDGMGISRVPAEDILGEPIPGEYIFVDCGECGGNGIKLGLCRQFAAQLKAKSST